MGPIARVLWECLPELLHVGAVLVVAAVMVAIMGNTLFGNRAESFASFTGQHQQDDDRSISLRWFAADRRASG